MATLGNPGTHAPQHAAAQPVGLDIPTRHSNPFATCWTRPGAIPFDFTDLGADATAIVDRLAASNWRGEIRGPHGSGKSTLLATLFPCIEERGWRSMLLTPRPPRRNIRFAEVRAVAAGSDRPLLLAIDGYEQLSRFDRWRAAQFAKGAGRGLLVTSHFPTRHPLLAELAPSRELVERLAGVLCAHRGVMMSEVDLATTLAHHDSNVREAFFALYELHERKRREETNVARR